MSFHVSPFHPAALRLLSHKQERTLQPRQPIAVRTQVQMRQRSILFGQALELSAQDSYQFGPNHFWIHRQLCSDNHGIEGHLVSSFSSLLSGTHFGLWLKETETGNYQTQIILAEEPLVQQTAINALFHCISSFLELDFTIDQRGGQIYLRTLKAERRGVAGKSLAALYAFARAISIGQITYSVSPCDNMNARQFYFHMDWGLPNNMNWDSAVVNVR